MKTVIIMFRCVFFFPTYCISAQYPQALQTSQAFSFAIKCPMLHPKVIFEPPVFETPVFVSPVLESPVFKAPCSCVHCDTESAHDGILRPSLSECLKTAVCFSI